MLKCGMINSANSANICIDFYIYLFGWYFYPKQIEAQQLTWGYWGDSEVGVNTLKLNLVSLMGKKDRHTVEVIYQCERVLGTCQNLSIIVDQNQIHSRISCTVDS